MDLGQFMAGIRKAETGNMRGDYLQIGKMQNGYQGRGAYNISPRNWTIWTQEAGIAGADWRSPQAQDLVAATKLSQFQSRYGSWDLAAVAWFAGPKSADSIAGQGYSGVDGIGHRQIKAYTKGVMDEATSAEATKYLGTYTLPKGSAKGNWMFPVAGETEWSRGSWMPSTKTHRGRTHAAIDVYAQAGTPIVAPVAGTVTKIGSGDIGGNTVTIMGDDGNTYYFAHMKGVPPVAKGQKITAGHHIGAVGNSGSAKRTKSHVHFSVKRDGKSLNPITMLEGATQGGGGFSMDTGVAEIPNQEQQGAGMMDSWIQSLSSAVAGGTRKDPRELAAWEEPSELQDKQMQAAPPAPGVGSPL